MSNSSVVPRRTERLHNCQRQVDWRRKLARAVKPTRGKPIASLFFDPIVCGKQQGFPTAARLRLENFLHDHFTRRVPAGWRGKGGVYVRGGKEWAVQRRRQGAYGGTAKLLDACVRASEWKAASPSRCETGIDWTSRSWGRRGVGFSRFQRDGVRRRGGWRRNFLQGAKEFCCIVRAVQQRRRAACKYGKS